MVPPQVKLMIWKVRNGVMPNCVNLHRRQVKLGSHVQDVGRKRRQNYTLFYGVGGQGVRKEWGKDVKVVASRASSIQR